MREGETEREREREREVSILFQTFQSIQLTFWATYGKTTKYSLAKMWTKILCNFYPKHLMNLNVIYAYIILYLIACIHMHVYRD